MKIFSLGLRAENYSLIETINSVKRHDIKYFIIMNSRRNRLLTQASTNRAHTFRAKYEYNFGPIQLAATAGGLVGS